MKLLDGSEVAGYIMGRHAGQARSFDAPLRLAIVREGHNPAIEKYLPVQKRYAEDIGVELDVYAETAETLVDRVKSLGADPAVTGIVVKLPLAHPELTDAALAAVPVAKDVDGLAPGTRFEAATPKAVSWLLAAYNVDLAGRVLAVVGQGRLVGKPLADAWEASGYKVLRLDDSTTDLAEQLRGADVVVAATGVPGVITADMLQPGAVVVDVGSPASELAADVRDRTDLTITPNPGGVGPMTVVSLFDNLLIATQNQRSSL